MTRMRIRKLLRGTSLVVALGLSIVLGACSSSGSGGNTGPAGSTADAKPAVATPTRPSSSAGGTGQSTPATGGDIDVTLKNNSFPKEIRVKAGAKVVFVVANKADVEHSFELPDFNVLKKIQPGQSARIAWTVPDKKGKWDMGCFLTDPSEDLHADMEGTLIIE